LHRKLVETFGVDEADLLLDRPPGGWSDLVTNQTLDRRFERGFRNQTWKLVSAMTALMAIVVAARRV
jgi:hypothetical protein